MISRFFTTEPAPLDVRVARVVATPWPFAAYFLIRAPQVAEGVMVPWPEAVTVTLLAAVLVPLWLYWVADLVGWTRERRTAEPSELELTADLSDHGTFEGDLRALVDAEAHGRAVPVRFRDAVLHGVRAVDPPKTHRATNYLIQSQLYASDWAAEQHEKLTDAGAILMADGETYAFNVPSADSPGPQPGTGLHAAVERFALATDDRPTEPLLLTHEFTPASGIVMDGCFADPAADVWEPLGTTDEGVTMSWDTDTYGDVIMSWDPAADGQTVVAVAKNGRVYPVDRVDVVKTPAGGIVMDYPNQIGDSPAAMMSLIRDEIAAGRTATGRHRRVEPRPQAIPPIADVPNAEAYAFLNRSRELGY